MDNKINVSENTKTITPKKQRLIAKMIAYSLLGVTSINLGLLSYMGIKMDLLEKDIDALNEQKIETTEKSQIEEIDARINELTAKTNKLKDATMPAVYSFIGTGIVGYSTGLAVEIQEDKEKELAERNELNNLTK